MPAQTQNGRQRHHSGTQKVLVWPFVMARVVLVRDDGNDRILATGKTKCRETGGCNTGLVGPYKYLVAIPPLPSFHHALDPSAFEYAQRPVFP
jgi:hypothetical protein